MNRPGVFKGAAVSVYNWFCKFKNIFISILVIAPFIFIGNYLYKSWPLIANSKLQINIGWLMVVTIFFTSQHFIYVSVWRRLLAYLEVKLSYTELLRIHFSTLLIKYIPGRILFPFSRGYFIKNKGASAKHATSVIFIDLILGLIAALVIAIIFLVPFKFDNRSMIKFLYPSLYIPMFLGLFCLSRKESQRSLKNLENNKRKFNLAKMIIYFMPVYLFLAISDGVIFYMFVNLFLPIHFDKINFFIGINSILRSIFSLVPGQVGLSESIQIALLKDFLKEPFFVLVPLLMRVWKICIEVALFLIVRFIFSKREAGSLKVQ